MVGGVIGVVAGGAVGREIGGAIGEQIDGSYLDNYQCQDCGHSFKA